MYNETMTNSSDTRPYRKKKRAAQEEDTRLRTTQAVVDLHRTVGPANTRVTEVAERAGVSRMTVYNHFPEEIDLIHACSSHWASLNPFPEPALWAETPDPSRRLNQALDELYAWYGETEDMMGKVLRDAPLVSALDQVLSESWWPYMEEVVTVLSEGWPGLQAPGPPSSEGASGRGILPALRLAVDFRSWDVLDKSGLSPREAADLMTRMIACLGAQPQDLPDPASV